MTTAPVGRRASVSEDVTSAMVAGAEVGQTEIEAEEGVEVRDRPVTAWQRDASLWDHDDVRPVPPVLSTAHERGRSPSLPLSASIRGRAGDRRGRFGGSGRERAFWA